MTPAGRTIWQAQDSAWWRRERIVLLGEQFGSEGPAVANWLECEAKAQNDGGEVKAGLTTAARGAFIQGGADRAREIVEFASEIGFLKDYEPGVRTFTARISAYADDQPAGRAAFRKAEQRASDSGTSLVKGQTVPLSRSVTPSHAQSRPVTGGHGESRPSTREERREEKNLPPDPPAGGRKRDREPFEEEMRVWCRSILDRYPDLSTILPDDGAPERHVRLATDRLRLARKDATPELVRDRLVDQYGTRAAA